MNFETFEKGDIGFHFGTQDQALQRGKQRDAKSGRMFRVYLNIKNPVYLGRDNHAWNANSAALLLWDAGILTKAEFNSVDLLWQMGDKYNSASAKKLREILASKGYDGIAYPNGFESNGWSYIAFYDHQIIKTENIPVSADALRKPDPLPDYELDELYRLFGLTAEDKQRYGNHTKTHRKN